MPGWVVIVFLAVSAVLVVLALRGRVPAWALVILTVILAPVGAVVMLLVATSVYAIVAATG